MFKGDKYLVLLPICCENIFELGFMSPETFPERKPKVHGKCPDTRIFFFFTDTLNLSKCPFIKLIKKKTTLSKSDVGGVYSYPKAELPKKVTIDVLALSKLYTSKIKPVFWFVSDLKFSFIHPTQENI